jgi:predicted phosphoribosyltransferase
MATTPCSVDPVAEGHTDEAQSYMVRKQCASLEMKRKERVYGRVRSQLKKECQILVDTGVVCGKSVWL